MLCTLCDQFIWAEGSSLNGRRVCAACVKKIAVDVGLMDKSSESVKDAVYEGVFDDIYNAIRDAAQDAAEDAIRRVKAAQKKPVAA